MTATRLHQLVAQQGDGYVSLEVAPSLAHDTAGFEDKGVASFAKTFDELIQALNDKASALAE